MRKIRDENGKWLDTSVFRQEALRFLEKGFYTEAPTGTPEWVTYWKEQLERCTNGYEVIDSDGTKHKITGHFYAYLNFGQILKVEYSEDEDDSVAKKITSFPDFWDGDYNFFWVLDIARNGLYSKESQAPSTTKEVKRFRELNKKLKNLDPNEQEYLNIKDQRDFISQGILDRIGLLCKPHLDYLTGGYHFIIAKSRRKGFSFKSGFIVANTYNTIRDSLSNIGAFEKKFIDQTMDKTLECLNFFNEFTGFSKNRLIDKRNYIKAGYIETVNGINIEKGFKSIVDATRTFKDNPDAMRGLDMYLCLLEEAGAFDNLKDSLSAIAPALTAGSKITGQIILGGTSGDLEKGTKDYADIFYNPIAYGFMPFVNTWDKDAENTVCGYFHPIQWNLEGFYDKQGNSDVEGAIAWEMERRQKILDNSSSPALLQKHMQEFPLCPADAFSVASSSIFPVQELRVQLNKVLSESLHLKKGTPVNLHYQNGHVVASSDLSGELEPIWNYKPKVSDLKGAVVIYEYPSKNPPRGLYKIGFDPYRQDKGSSLASIIVYKGVQQGAFSKNCIVAEYIGRPYEADDVNRIAQMLAELYNTEIMHENEVTHVKNYFRRIKRLDLLAAQPDAVISSNIKNSKVARVYGCHMDDKLKDAAEKYTKDWLMEIQDYDEHGNPIRSIDRIYSIGLLEELIQYYRKGNFDRVSSLFMVMFQVQEEVLGKEYTSGESNSRVNEFISVLNNFYRK